MDLGPNGAMSQRVNYGLNAEAVCFYDVLVEWELAFKPDPPAISLKYVPAELIEDIEQRQRRDIIKRLPDSDIGRKWLILNFFHNGL